MNARSVRPETPQAPILRAAAFIAALIMLAALMLPTLAFANGGVDSSARAALDSSLVTVSLKETSSGGELLVETRLKRLNSPAVSS